MLTPQDVTNREFDKAVFGGYDIGAVDKFLEELSQDYSALYRDNATLKGKLKVLVDKVEEYRNTEDAMRLALLTAQKTARELTEEAEAKAAEIIAEAQRRGDSLLAEAEKATESRRLELKASLRDEENALLNAKRRTGEYLERLDRAVEEYRESLQHIYDFTEPLGDLPPVQTAPQPEEASAEEEQPAPQPEEAPAEPELSISVEDVADMIQRSFESREPEEKPEEPGEEANLPHIDYDNLKFGADYDRDKKKK